MSIHSLISGGTLFDPTKWKLNIVNKFQLPNAALYVGEGKDITLEELRSKTSGSVTVKRVLVKSDAPSIIVGLCIGEHKVIQDPRLIDTSNGGLYSTLAKGQYNNIFVDIKLRFYINGDNLIWEQKQYFQNTSTPWSCSYLVSPQFLDLYGEMPTTPYNQTNGSISLKNNSGIGNVPNVSSSSTFAPRTKIHAPLVVENFRVEYEYIVNWARASNYYAPDSLTVVPTYSVGTNLVYSSDGIIRYPPFMMYLERI